MARNNVKPSYKWVGSSESRSIETVVATSPADVQLALGSSVIVEANNDVLFETMFISHAVRRLLTTGMAFIHVLVAMQKVDSASGLPIEVLDPSAGAGFDIANRDIVAWYQLPIPPIVFNDTLASIDRSVHITEKRIKVRRRIQRANHAMTLTIVSDVDNVVSARTITRTLLRLN